MLGDKEAKVYLLLSVIFCSIIVTGNLIFQKFVYFGVSDLLHFEVSIGVLLYPVTFIVTDLITEFFGKKRAQYTVVVSIICDVLIMGLIYLSIALPATNWSPVSDEVFAQVFSGYGVASVASLIACFISQNADIIIFSWVKKHTGDKMLWIRCNVSAICGQIIDTISVCSLLCIFGIIPMEKLLSLITSSLAFKLLAATLLSTPLYYFCYFIISRCLDKVSTNAPPYFRKRSH